MSLTQWHNVTHEAPNWDMNPLDGIRLDGVSSHNYFAYLENRIRARVTFSDGAIVESRAEDEPVIRVLPGPGWLPPEERLFWTESWVQDGEAFTGRKVSGGRYVGKGTMTIGLRIIAGGYHYDCMGSAHYAVNWGDGSGWQDISSDRQRWGRAEGEAPSADNLTVHTFTKPGRHVVETRIRYWDGELLTIDDMAGTSNGIFIYLDVLPADL